MPSQKRNSRIRLNNWVDYLDFFDRFGWNSAVKLVKNGLQQEKNLISIRRTFPTYVDLNTIGEAFNMHDNITSNMLTIARHYYPEQLEGEPDSKESKQLKMLKEDLLRGISHMQDYISKGSFSTPRSGGYGDILVYIMHFNRILNSRHYDSIQEALRMTEDNFIQNYVYVLLSKAGLYPAPKGEGKIQIKTGEGNLDI